MQCVNRRLRRLGAEVGSFHVLHAFHRDSGSTAAVRSKPFPWLQQHQQSRIYGLKLQGRKGVEIELRDTTRIPS